MKVQIAGRTRGFDQHPSPIPDNFFCRRGKNQPASRTREFLSQEIRNRNVTSLDAKQSIRGNRILRRLLLRKRRNRNTLLIGGVESLDVIAGGPGRERIYLPAFEILGKAYVASTGLLLHPLPQIFEYVFCCPALLVCRRQSAAIEPER